MVNKGEDNLNHRFYELPAEKQQRIVNAGFRTFAKNGYKKATTEEIANEAMISKPLLFHYFKNKKGYFEFLYGNAISYISQNIFIDEISKQTDFFEMLKQSTIAKLAVFRDYPYLYEFVLTAYKEDVEEVKSIISSHNEVSLGKATNVLFNNINKAKFKENVDFNLFVKVLMWMSEGYLKEMLDNKSTDFDRISTEYSKIIDMFKTNFYKEEYLQ